MIAYCGLDCEKCNAYIATKTNDNKLRKATAQEWSKLFKTELRAEDINCTGCKSTGVKLYYCGNLCEIRKCATKKQLENCGLCETYPCDKLDFIFKSSSEAKANLDKMQA
jgi:hypothetical protein